MVQKGSFCGCCEAAVQYFLYHKKRVAHYCAVLNHATVTGEPKNRIYVYNAEALGSIIPCIYPDIVLLLLEVSVYSFTSTNCTVFYFYPLMYNKNKHQKKIRFYTNCFCLIFNFALYYSL